MTSFDLGRYYCANPHHALLHHVLEDVVGRYPRTIYGGTHGGKTGTEVGCAVEFGTGSGDSARCISQWMYTITFGSPDGLPEDWREGFPAGSFAERPRGLSNNVEYVEGLFADTLPKFPWDQVAPIRLVHCDADLYSSTSTALGHISAYLEPGAVLVFDEFWGYPGAEDHEQRAFAEFIKETGFDYTPLGHGHEAYAVKLK